MKTPLRFLEFTRTFINVVWRAAGLVALCVSIAPVASAAPSVDIATQPLILRPEVAPNIVLMLDDSGSMNWNFMPDWDSLKNNTNNDAVIDAANNGVYYDPTVTYTPPPKAQTGSYDPQTDMTNVRVDGFGSLTTATTNLLTYNGNYDYNECGGNVCGGSDIDYNVSKTVQVSTQPAIYNQSVSYTYGSNRNGWYIIYADQVCQSAANSFSPYANYKFTGTSKNNGNWLSGQCSFSYATPVNQTFSFFQYSTGPAAGPYTVHYITDTSASCTNAPDPTNCVGADDTSGTSAPSGIAAGTNVANWFAYYHTRILMAKTGLMAGFYNLSPAYRFGFGSINDNAYNRSHSNLPSPNASYGSNSNQIAQVQLFGNGSSGTQKAAFWNWVVNETANGSTPLRRSLQAVGQYYQTSQPWQSMSTDDPGYVSASNPGPALSCRAAYTILTTDGFWNGKSPSSVVEKSDSTYGPGTITGPSGATYTYQPAAPYSESHGSGSPSATLADVASYYWKTDLSSLSNEVPVNDDDPAFWQHMTTFTMGLGFDPVGIQGTVTVPVEPATDPPTYTDRSADVADVFKWASGGTSISNFSWPTPSSDSVNNIADLAHAALTGHGAFFSAKNPQAFTSGIQTAIQRVTERVGTGASLAANSTQLETGSFVYQANYYTVKWKGDLKALPVSKADGSISATATWQASQKMPAAANRNIVTYNKETGTFVPFDSAHLASLSGDEQTALGSDATTQAAVINYLRGDQSKEQNHTGGTYRIRDTVLGDIVNSQPVYSGAPNANEFLNQTFYGSGDFAGWALSSAVSGRTPTIYVAANDGMLHAFRADTGVETFAYLPGAVIIGGPDDTGTIRNVADLANPDYGSTTDPHQYFNDGQLTIADAYIDTSGGNSPSWHTILVGTTGLGPAPTVYALDITDPGNIKPLWERSAGDGKAGSNYIGQMLGKPVIAQTSNTGTSSTWSVLMGNGYNSKADPPTNNNSVAALLQFDLVTGNLTVHETTDTTTGNGLAAPVAWMDTPSNGVSTVAYAGDLHGHVWAFKLSDDSPGSQVFTAVDKDGNAQPITAGMLAGSNPATGDVWLFFGTGRYLAKADLSDLSTQTWYGIIVKLGASSTQLVVPSNASARSGDNLVQRTITHENPGGAGDPPSLPSRTISSPTTVTDANGNVHSDMYGSSGWYLDLLSPDASGNDTVHNGERMVNPSQFQGPVLLGVTRVPTATDPCNPSGSGWIMAVNAFTGSALPSSFFDVNRNGVIDTGDSVLGGVAAGVMFGALPNSPIFISNVMEVSFDNGTTASIGTDTSSGVTQRVDWREVSAQ